MAWVLTKGNGIRPLYFQGKNERTGQAEFSEERMYAQRFESCTHASTAAKELGLIGFAPASIWG